MTHGNLLLGLLFRLKSFIFQPVSYFTQYGTGDRLTVFWEIQWILPDQVVYWAQWA
jgi:hypothetical protein